MKIGSIAACMLLFAAASVYADDNLQGLQTRQQFETTRTNAVKGMADRTDPYRELSPADQTKLKETLDRMEQRWQKTGDDGKLMPVDQVAMANDQEIVLGILNRATADSRVVCERVAKIGTNLPTNQCETVGQRRRELNDAQNAANVGNLETH